MDLRIMFIESKVREAEDIYRNVDITRSQRKIIEVLAAKLHEYVPMKEIAIRGFALKATREWQLANRELAASLENLTTKERMKFMKEVLNIMKGSLSRCLIDPKEKNKIDEGIEATLQFYAKEFAKR